MVAAEGDPWELYNLKEDRSETRNLLKEHPEKAKKLEILWNRQFEETNNLAAKTLTKKGAKTPRGKAKLR